MFKEKSEAKIQQEIYLWFHNNYCLKNHDPQCIIFSVPNESSNKREMMFKKSIGLVSGVSDMIVILPGKVLFVEIKTKVGRQSDKQKVFEETVTKLGFRYVLVRSLEEFKLIIENDN